MSMANKAVPAMADMQVVLTRLQQALGLKGESKITSKDVAQGGLRTVELDVGSTRLHTRKDNVILICVDLEVLTDGAGKPYYVDYGIASLDTKDLQGVAPGSVDAEAFIAKICNPLGEGSNVHRGSPSVKTLFSEETLGALREPIEVCFTEPYVLAKKPGETLDAALAAHKVKSQERNMVLLVNDNITTISDLDALGFEPDEIVSIVETVDLRELFAAYSARSQDKLLSNPDRLKRVTTVLDIMDCNAEDYLDHHELAKLSIAAVLKMAVKDAAKSQPIRILEQVKGGDFPGLYKDVEEMAHDGMTSSDRLTLDTRTPTYPTRAPSTPTGAAATTSAQPASPASSTSSFSSGASTPSSSSYTTASSSPPSLAARLSAALNSPTSYFEPALPTQIGDRLPLKYAHLNGTVKQWGFELVGWMSDAVNCEGILKSRYQRMFSPTIYEEPDGNRLHGLHITCKDIRIVARELHAHNLVSDGMTKHLRKILKARFTISNWYHALPNGDHRKAADENHRLYAQTLMEVLVIMLQKS